MTWFKVDTALWRSRKVRKLGERDKLASAGLWTLAGTWSSDNLSDGFVPWDVIEDWDPKHRYAFRLVEVGLWDKAQHDDEDGIQFHDWQDYQPTAEQVKAERAAGAERQRKLREARRTSGSSNGVTGTVTPNATNGERPTPPTRPDPTRTSSGDFGGGSLEPAGRENRPPERCSKHTNDLDAPPCGACANARRLAEAWDADEPRRARDERLTIRACRLCDADGWRLTPGTRVPASPYARCDHHHTAGAR